jgi:FkbM family methyltransferase
MARLGWRVRAYEPDFAHYQRLLENLERNGVTGSVKPYMAAVSTAIGNATFVRVLNNLTGNHLEGFKDSYGPTERVIVPTMNCRYLWGKSDFAKIDSEGNEAELIKTWDTPMLDAILEVRNGSNAREIYDHCNKIGAAMWSQKRDWQRVINFEDMPMANREGSLFIGQKGPWL